MKLLDLVSQVSDSFIHELLVCSGHVITHKSRAMISVRIHVNAFGFGSATESMVA